MISEQFFALAEIDLFPLERTSEQKSEKDCSDSAHWKAAFKVLLCFQLYSSHKNERHMNGPRLHCTVHAATTLLGLSSRLKLCQQCLAINQANRNYDPDWLLQG